jgi:hypothetical protein
MLAASRVELPIVQWGTMDWVERRKASEDLVAARAPGVWLDLCASVKQSIISFNKLYGNYAEVAEPHKNVLRVTRSYNRSESPDSHNTLTLTYAPEVGIVKSAFSAPYREVVFSIETDGSTVSLCYKGSPQTAEQASRVLLEPMLFGPFDNSAAAS